MPLEAFPACRFYVQIGGNTEAVFTEVRPIELTMTTEPIEEGGQNDSVHQLPGRTRASNLVLQRGMTRSNDFCKWYMNTAPGNLTRQNVTLSMYDVNGKPLQRWTFRNAYPVRWQSSAFEASSTAVALETLELAHEGVTLE
jgi:phage tail-like protein